MQLSGWGNFPIVQGDLLAPAGSAELQVLIKDSSSPTICRGGGRSYGDSALAHNVVSSRYLDNFLEFDKVAATVRCGAGISMEQLIEIATHNGLFPAVLPGTKYVTVGGAIAADIHGKNHHIDGSFCDHVLELNLLLADGTVLNCSPANNSEIFHASCGGMGLTGIVLDATLQLIRVPSTSISSQSFIAENLDHCLRLLDEFEESKYVVAWLDCLAHGENLGRSVVYIGDHLVEEKEKQNKTRRLKLNIPFSSPGFILNRFTVTQFNNLYFNVSKLGNRNIVQDCESFFFPLDRINNWNRLYGRKGFLQYQVLIPDGNDSEGSKEAQKTLREIIKLVADSGQGSFLSVLKRFGKGNMNLLSFPDKGYTLTLDFRWRESLFPLLDSLDSLVLSCGGRHYLAKDARLSESTFRAGYPRWQEFMSIKKKLDPKDKFASLQSDRLGLTSSGL